MDDRVRHGRGFTGADLGALTLLIREPLRDSRPDRLGVSAPTVGRMWRRLPASGRPAATVKPAAQGIGRDHSPPSAKSQ